MQLNRFLALSLIAASILACDDDDDITTPAPSFANVRLLNAVAGTTNLDVVTSGSTTPLATGLDFGEFTTACVQVPAGSAQTLSFRSGGTALASASYTFGKDANYTVVLSTKASDASRAVTVLPDTSTLPAPQNGVRFVNTSATPGDFYIAAPGTTPGDLKFGNLAPVANYLNVVPSAYAGAHATQTVARAFDVGVTTGTPRAELALGAFAASRRATIVLLPGTPAFLQVNPCQ